MSIDLKQYIDSRLDVSPSASLKKKPFITISRDTGCNSFAIGKLLQKMIHNATSKKWGFVTKELIEENAKALQLNLTQVRGILESEKRGHLEEVLRAFGNRYYKSDRSIRNTLKTIIEAIARDGNVIIIGRAGAAITSELENGLHFRLTAPLDWRIKKMQREKGFSLNEAIEYVNESDQKRNNLFFDFNGKNIADTHFDLVLNNERLSDQEIALLIFELMTIKEMLKS